MRSKDGNNSLLIFVFLNDHLFSVDISIHVSVILVRCQVGTSNRALSELSLSLFLIKEEDTPQKGSVFTQF